MHKGDSQEAAEPARPGGHVARIVLWAVAGLFGVAMVALVVGSSIRPELPTYAPSLSRDQAFGDTLVGPLTYTIDAQDETEWHFFDFSSGSAVDNPSWDVWDVAFQRHFIIVNGGAGFRGSGGIRWLSGDSLAGEVELPLDGYLDTRVINDSSVRHLEKWYDYSFIRHVLTPRDGMLAVRTADGRYAAFRVLSYYCDTGVGGCFTLRYWYLGDGSRTFTPGNVAG